MLYLNDLSKGLPEKEGVCLHCLYGPGAITTTHRLKVVHGHERPPVIDQDKPVGVNRQAGHVVILSLGEPEIITQLVTLDESHEGVIGKTSHRKRVHRIVLNGVPDLRETKQAGSKWPWPFRPSQG